MANIENNIHTSIIVSLELRIIIDIYKFLRILPENVCLSYFTQSINH